MKPGLVLLTVGLVLPVALSQSRNVVSTRWILEFRDSSKPSERGLVGTLELTSGSSITMPRSFGNFTLGEASLGARLAPLIDNSCLNVVGKADLSRRHDSLVIDFLPHPKGCGLIASGVVRSDTVTGSWYQQGYTTHAPEIVAKGRFSMWRAR